MNIPAILWIILLPLASSPFIYLIGRLGDADDKTGQMMNASRWASLIVLLGTVVPFFRTYNAIRLNGPQIFTMGMVSLQIDGMSLLLAAIALSLGIMVVLFSGPYLSGEDGEEKFYALLTAMIGAMIGLVCAADLFNLWVWFETMAISSYALVAFYRKQPGALEAGVKYLVQSATGSVLVVLGIILVFGQMGTLSLDQLRASVTPSPVLLAAGALFIIGFGVKAALVPLHTWLPDAHSQAPSGISAMLSGVVIEAGLLAMLRTVGALAGVTSMWGFLLMGFGAVNMLFGNLMALRQQQVKRLLAYSSLVNVGYMLVGIGIGIAYHQVNGTQGGLFHLFNHGLMKGLAFLAAGALLYSLHIARGNHNPLTIDDLAGASRRYPIVAFTFSVALLGLGGLPPLAGFMSKWQIFLAGYQTQQGWAEALVIFAALNSVLSLGYYAPLVNRMYRHEPGEIVQQGKPVPVLMTIPLIIMTVAIVVIGLWPSLMSWLVGPAGTALLAAFGG